MASTTVDFIINAKATGNGVKSLTKDLEAQKRTIKELQSAEKARSAAARAQLAQQRALDASAQASATKTVAAQMKAARAYESARAATARADIAAKQHAATMAEAGSAIDKVSGNVGGVNALAAAFTALGAAVAVAVAGIGLLGQGLGAAIKNESASVMQTHDLMRALNIDKGAAGGLVGQINSGLRGNADWIDMASANIFSRGFADDFLAAGKSVKDVVDFASRASALLQSSGVDPGALQNVFTDMLSGSVSTDALKGRDALIDTGLDKVIIPMLESAGKELKDMTRGERAALIMKALQGKVTDDLIADMQGTVQGIWTGFMSRIKQAFSVENDLFPDQAGVQSIFEQFKQSVKTLFGKGGIFDNVGRIMDQLGIGPTNIMQSLYSGWKKLNQWLEGLNKFLQGFNASDFGSINISGAGIGTMLAKVSNVLFQATTNVFNQIAAGLYNFDWAGVTRGFFSGVSAFFTNLDWGALLNTAVASMNILGALTVAMVQIGVGLSQALIAGFNQSITILTQSLTMLATTTQTIWSGFVTSAQAIWNSMVTSVTSIAQSLVTAIQSAWTSLSEGVTSLIQSAVETTQSIWSSIVEAIQSGWNSIVSAVQEKIQAAVSAVQSFDLASAVSGLFSAIQGAISSAKSAIGGLLGGGGKDASASYNAVAMSPVGYGSSYNIGGISIYQQPGESAEALANRVLQVLDDRLKQRMIAMGV